MESLSDSARDYDPGTTTTRANRDNCVDDVDCGAVDATALPATDSATQAGELKGWLTGLEPATPRITI